MEQDIINAIDAVTQEKKLNRKQIYEHLLARGVVQPNSESVVFDVLERALKEGYIPRNRVVTYRKKAGKLPDIFTQEQPIFSALNTSHSLQVD